MCKQIKSIWIMMALILLIVLSACGQSATTNSTNGDSTNAATETETKTDWIQLLPLNQRQLPKRNWLHINRMAGEVQVPEES
ncbi:hypothetical protein Q0F98_35760 [Paenibacillus amylolyticus]|nr:hypothetical protein Q0F98_35760 [Paenibacillus amylolyticus]